MISYANMKLKPVTTTHKFEWNGNEIEVLDYLPIEDKYDLIMITLQKSFEDGYYNPIKIDEFFDIFSHKHLQEHRILPCHHHFATLPDTPAGNSDKPSGPCLQPSKHLVPGN